MGLKIQLLGRPAVVGDDGASRVVRGHQAWAVLARVLLSERPVGRRELASQLFPDAVDPLGSLRWCLATLRRAVGSEAFHDDPIQPNLPPDTDVDVWNIVNGKYDAATAGDLLEGVDPRAGAEFDTWLLIERERMASLIDSGIRQETMAALSSGDFGRATRVAELGARRRPLDESAHVLLVRSLVMDGRHEAALKHVEATERFFRAELGEDPTPALRSAARMTIASAPVGVSPRAVVSSLIDSGVAALAAGAVEAGLDCLRRAATDAERANDSHLRARSLCELGSALVHSVRGYDDEGAVYLRQAVACARQCGAAAIAAAALRELGYLEALAGRRPAAARILDEALEASGDDRDSLAGVHGTIAYNLVDWGKHDDGLAHHERALDYARSVGNRRREIWALGLGGWGHLAAGQAESARLWARDCVAVCDEIRWRAFRPFPVCVLSEAQLRLQGEPAALRQELEDAFALSCQLNDPCWEAAAARVVGLTYAADDDHEAAMEWLVRARASCTRVTDPYAALLVQILADQVAVSQKAGNDDLARSIAREYLSAAARTHADAHLRQAVALVGKG